MSGYAGSSLARVVALAVVASACGLSSSTPRTDEVEAGPEELAARPGGPCPATLPVGEDPGGHGFGSEVPADERPAFLEPEEAWVCRYDAVDAGRTAHGAVYAWGRAGAELAEVDVEVLSEALDELTLPDTEPHACTAALGPCWLVAFSHGGDLTGVVVDDYGCRSVRLTDDPFVRAPGDPGQEGTVGGALEGGAGLLAALGVGRGV